MKRPALLAAAAAVAAFSTHAFATSIALAGPEARKGSRGPDRADHQRDAEHPERTEPELGRPLAWLVAADLRRPTETNTAREGVPVAMAFDQVTPRAAVLFEELDQHAGATDLV